MDIDPDLDIDLDMDVDPDLDTDRALKITQTITYRIDLSILKRRKASTSFDSFLDNNHWLACLAAIPQCLTVRQHYPFLALHWPSSS